MGRQDDRRNEPTARATFFCHLTIYHREAAATAVATSECQKGIKGRFQPAAAGVPDLAGSVDSEQIIGPNSGLNLTTVRWKANISATRVMRFARPDEVERYRRRRLTALPFRA